MTRGAPTRRPTPPLEGLLAGLRLALGAGNGSAQRAALRRVGDWPGLEALAAYHRVSGLFLRGVANGGVRLPDPEVAGGLARMRQRDAVRGLRQFDATKRITAAFEAAGIPSLVLKGLPLAQRVYGDPFAKHSIDIDLLVPGDDFGAAADVLREAGWRQVTPAFRETPARMRWYAAVEKDHQFVGAGGKVELHRRLLRNRFLFDPPFELLDAGAVTVQVGAHRFRTLGDADQLLYLACHGSLDCWRRLKWLCDFAALLRVMADDVVGQAVARGREQRLEHLVAASLRLCREELHVEAPKSLTAPRRHGVRTWFVVGLSRRWWTPGGAFRHVLRTVVLRAGRVCLGTGVRYGVHEARGLLVGRHDFSRLDLPDRFFWLYFVLWPLLAALRVLGRRQG